MQISFRINKYSKSENKSWNRNLSRKSLKVLLVAQKYLRKFARPDLIGKLRSEAALQDKIACHPIMFEYLFVSKIVQNAWNIIFMKIREIDIGKGKIYRYRIWTKKLYLICRWSHTTYYSMASCQWASESVLSVPPRICAACDSTLGAPPIWTNPPATPGLVNQVALVLQDSLRAPPIL